MITMVLGGLWHGAAWTFVAWGAIHGSGQVVGHLRRSHRVGARVSTPCPTARWRVAVQRVVTFHIVCLGWIFFRADSFSTAITLIGRLFTAWGRAPLVTPLVVVTVVGTVALQYLPRALGGRAQRRIRPSTVGGARGHTGGRSSRDHDARPTGCRTVHLLQVLSPVPSVRRSDSRSPRGGSEHAPAHADHMTDTPDHDHEPVPVTAAEVTEAEVAAADGPGDGTYVGGDGAPGVDGHGHAGRDRHGQIVRA